jgi:hypothetical protein
VKGPGNADLEPAQLECIHSTFCAAGVPNSRILHPIQTILLTDPGSVARRAR